MEKAKRFYREEVVLRPEAGSFTAEAKTTHWSNKDLDPVEKRRQLWQWYHIGGFWVAEGFNVAQMQTPSTAVALGLGLVIIAMLIGNILVTVGCMSQGYIGSKYHVNFPVLARVSFGMWGSYIAMVVRGIVCAIWYGVQSSLGGTSVQCMIEAIWPSYQTWHINALPASAAITVPSLLCFTLFWLASLPFLYLSIPTLRWFFIIKIIVMPFFGVTLFTWALTAAHGWGPLFSIPSNIQNGWSISYAFCIAIAAGISGVAPFAINQGDITRYAHDARAAWLSQLFLPLCVTLTELLGTVLAASSQVLYGQVIWNPLMIVLLWDNRAAKFFAGFLFAFANIGTNVAGNSIPFSNDLMGIFPRCINIRRGQFICAILGFAICPWLIEATPASFLAFLNGYTVFLGPLVGVIMSDYWLVRRGRGLNVYNLYKPHGLYWYSGGWNFRATTAWLIGTVPQIPGLTYQINHSLTNISPRYLNFATLAWLDGLVFSLVSYYLLYLAFPFPTQTDEEDKAPPKTEVDHFENQSSAADSHHDEEKKIECAHVASDGT
ncbi:MAG: hypothetical protein MMC33_002721 [Icmadophila ericetorum]|nr:hypothetical protein [Icmadophila ericetorum]